MSKVDGLIFTFVGVALNKFNVARYLYYQILLH